MIKYRIISITLILAILAGIFFVGGNNKSKEAAPALIEPSIVNSSYREVRKGNIGKLCVENARVVPMQYYHTFPTSVTISKINVNIGDYVKKGDVLVCADVDSVSKSIAELDKKIKLEKENHAITLKIQNEELKILEFELKGLEELGDTDAVNEKKKQIAEAKENQSFDNKMYDFYRRKDDEARKELSELLVDSTIKATHDGYVTYLYSITNAYTNSQSNIVTISDYDDVYLELKDFNVNDYSYRKYENKYVLENNKKIKISEFDYSTEELAAAKSYNLYPQQRLKFDDNSNYKVGDDIPVFFVEKDIQNVLIVGNDSLQNDGDTVFVYVKNSEGGLDRRNIEVGAADDNFTEVVSGLAEGEIVYFSSDAMTPSKYDEYEVKLSDINVENVVKTYNVAINLGVIVNIPIDGVFGKKNYAEGDDFEKGQVLATINTEGGKADIEEAKNAISHAKADYSEACKAYDKNMKELIDRLNAITNPVIPPAPIATDTDAEPEEDETEQINPYEKDIIKCNMEILKYNKVISDNNYKTNLSALEKRLEDLKAKNNGSGTRNIIAPCSGKIRQEDKMVAKEGAKVSEGNRLCNIYYGNGKLIWVLYKGKAENMPGLGKEVIFKHENKEYKGKIVGECGSVEHNNLYSYKNRIYVTTSNPVENIGFFVYLDDNYIIEHDITNAEIYYKECDLKGASIVKTNMVFQEAVKTKVNTYYNYVWKVVNGELTKQYVQIYKLNDSEKDKLEINKDVIIVNGLVEGDIVANPYEPVTDEKEEN